MLHCKLVSQDSETYFNGVYETSTVNFGNDFNSITLKVFSNSLVELMVKHFEPNELIEDWINFSYDILDCNLKAVYEFLKRSSNNDERYNDLVNFLKSLDEHSLSNAISYHSVCMVDTYFLEHFIDNIRESVFNDLPSRFECDLAFSSLKDARKYLELAQLDSEEELQLYEVEIKEKIRLFEADQNFLNQIDYNTPIHVAIGNIHGYWSGSVSSDPLMEVLIKGSLRLKSKLNNQYGL